MTEMLLLYCISNLEQKVEVYDLFFSTIFLRAVQIKNKTIEIKGDLGKKFPSICFVLTKMLINLNIGCLRYLARIRKEI